MTGLAAATTVVLTLVFSVVVSTVAWAIAQTVGPSISEAVSDWTIPWLAQILTRVAPAFALGALCAGPAIAVCRLAFLGANFWAVAAAASVAVVAASLTMPPAFPYQDPLWMAAEVPGCLFAYILIASADAAPAARPWIRAALGLAVVAWLVAGAPVAYPLAALTPDAHLPLFTGHRPPAAAPGTP